MSSEFGEIILSYPIYYIKNSNGEYWHRYKRKWKDKRENVPAYTDLHKLKEFLLDDKHKIHHWDEFVDYYVVCVEVTNEVKVDLNKE